MTDKNNTDTPFLVTSAILVNTNSDYNEQNTEIYIYYK